MCSTWSWRRAAPRSGRFGEGVFVAPLSAATGLDLDARVPGRARRGPAARAGCTRTRCCPGEVAGRGERRARGPLDELHADPPALPRRARSPPTTRWSSVPARRPAPLQRAAAQPLPAADAARAQRRTSDLAATAVGGRSRSTALQNAAVVRRRAAAQTDDPGHRAGVAHPAGARRPRRGRQRPRGRGGARPCSRPATRGASPGSTATSPGSRACPTTPHGERAVSPTALESYATCPHAFFVERLLGVEPLEQPEDIIEISAIEIGNLVHQALDRLISEIATELPGPGEPWTPRSGPGSWSWPSELADEFEARGLTGHPRLWERERPRILADLAWMLDDDDAWRAGSGARVVASELTFGLPASRRCGPDPGRRGTVLFKGSADKVDVAADGTLLVTDVKTGSKRRFKGISEDDPVRRRHQAAAAGVRRTPPAGATASRDTAGLGGVLVRPQGRAAASSSPLDRGRPGHVHRLRRGARRLDRGRAVPAEGPRRRRTSPGSSAPTATPTGSGTPTSARAASASGPTPRSPSSSPWSTPRPPTAAGGVSIDAPVAATTLVDAAGPRADPQRHRRRPCSSTPAPAPARPPPWSTGSRPWSCDDGVPLAQIAAVTFTEKAGAELRDRLRARFEAAWREPPTTASARRGRARRSTTSTAPRSARCTRSRSGSSPSTRSRRGCRRWSRSSTRSARRSPSRTAGASCRRLLDDDALAEPLLLALAAGIKLDSSAR